MSLEYFEARDRAPLLGFGQGAGERGAMASSMVFHSQLLSKTPDDHGELTGCRDGGDMLAAPGAYAQEERAQRTWSACGRPGRSDQHAARVAAARLGDLAVVGRSRT
jgi:hypothetical protein